MPISSRSPGSSVSPANIDSSLSTRTLLLATSTFPGKTIRGISDLVIFCIFEGNLALTEWSFCVSFHCIPSGLLPNFRAEGNSDFSILKCIKTIRNFVLKMPGKTQFSIFRPREGLSRGMVVRPISVYSLSLTQMHPWSVSFSYSIS